MNVPNNKMPNNNHRVTALSILLVVASFLVTPFYQSSAHVLQIDGSMGAVLHIDPNDAPIAQQPANFFLYFTSKTGTFSLANCTCTATLATADGTTIAQPTIQPEQGQSADGTFAYQFTSPAEYLLTVRGQPASGSAFQKFSLVYTFQVAPASGSASGHTSAFKSFFNSEHGLHYILFGAGFIVIFFLFLNESRKNKKPSQTSNAHDAQQKDNHEIR